MTAKDPLSGIFPARKKMSSIFWDILLVNKLQWVFCIFYFITVMCMGNADRDTVLFADRFPFRYLADDYGLKYYAAFAGCSAETDASFETMAFLVNKVNELDLKVILQLESAKGDIAKTVKRDAAADDIEILTANSLQSSTKRDFENGVTYLSLMRENLEVFRKALA